MSMPRRVRGLQARVGELEEALSRIDNLLKMPERQHVFGSTLSELIRKRIAEVVVRYRQRTSGQALLRLQRLQDQVIDPRADDQETADALGVAEPTVKTHLHRLFGKTGTGRQADLVKLVAGYANPLFSSSRLFAAGCHPIG